jgi:hypothetical protein
MNIQLFCDRQDSHNVACLHQWVMKCQTRGSEVWAAQKTFLTFKILTLPGLRFNSLCAERRVYLCHTRIWNDVRIQRKLNREGWRDWRMRSECNKQRELRKVLKVLGNVEENWEGSAWDDWKMKRMAYLGSNWRNGKKRKIIKNNGLLS